MYMNHNGVDEGLAYIVYVCVWSWLDVISMVVIVYYPYAFSWFSCS